MAQYVTIDHGIGRTVEEWGPWCVASKGASPLGTKPCIRWPTILDSDFLASGKGFLGIEGSTSTF